MMLPLFASYSLETSETGYTPQSTFHMYLCRFSAKSYHLTSLRSAACCFASLRGSCWFAPWPDGRAQDAI